MTAYGVEPYKLRHWRLSPAGGEFYTCARPGRSKRGHGKVPDRVVRQWACGLPGGTSLVVVSLLGKKPDGRDEFSFYSFFARHQSFQSWLNENDIGRDIQVIQHPTMDMASIPTETLKAVAADIQRLTSEGKTVVLMDSGGVTRTGSVCSYMHAIASAAS
jgi:hypothetical protein